MTDRTLTTTFTLVRNAGACADRYRHLARRLGGVRRYGAETPITLLQVLDHNGLDDALWALRAVDPAQTAERDRFARLLACDYAQHVLPIWQAAYPDDTRPADAIALARASAEGATDENALVAAGTAAAEAARAAARAAGWVAAWAARAAAWAAGADAPWAAAWAARDAARAARAAARADEIAWQETRFRQLSE